MPEGSVAQVEDWDSDESEAIPGTVVQAQQRQQQRDSRRHYQHQHTNQPHPSSSSVSAAVRRPRAPDVASDSGYSSLAAKSPVPPMTIPAQPVAPQQDLRSSMRKPKPVIHPGIQRADSARSTQQQQQRSQPVPAPTPAPAPAPAPSETQRRKCSDANCRDPNCGRAPDQRYSQSQRPVPPPQPQYTNVPPQYSPMQHYQYAQASQSQAAAMMPPPSVPMQRPRTASTSRQRPVSIHGYSSMSYTGVPAPSGPPPSQSAYYAYSQPYAQQPQPQPYMDPTPPTSTQMAPYAPFIPPSPTSPSITYPGYPGYSGTYSARQANPAVPGLEMPRQMPQPGLSRTMSARQRTEERPRRQLPAPPLHSESAGSESDSFSESEASDEEYDRRQRDPRRNSYRREKAMTLVHHPRRPSMSKKYHTETTVPTRARRDSMPREALRRAPRSDTFLDYPSSSDVGDSDRTARAVIDRRSTISSTRSSRRPSVSTTASSGRTKATTLSSMTDNSRGGQLVVEGKNGRRVDYLSKEDQAWLVRRYEQQQLEAKLDAQRVREEKIAAYQKNMNGGGDQYELTAENVKKANNRKSGSHVSGRSQKSSGSGSKVSRSEGIQIKSGDTVLHVYGDAKIEMRPSEDGGPAQFVIASSNGRESEYRTSSKSSGSRMGRSRVRSELSRRVIREDPNDYEDGYEVAR